MGWRYGISIRVTIWLAEPCGTEYLGAYCHYGYGGPGVAVHVVVDGTPRSLVVGGGVSAVGGTVRW